MHLVHSDPVDRSRPTRPDGHLCPVIPLTSLAEIRMRRLVRTGRPHPIDGGSGPDAA
ncbi:MAG: hypothetical protein S0880_37100 [Actinomycetota bacterium]|nr:hypothetical protein [Actinomycetota bacterium]